MANKGRLTTEIFCLFLAGLLAWHIALPDRARSETENRTLAQFPDFSWETLKNGSFTAGMEDYFADQFPLRDDWTGLHARGAGLGLNICKVLVNLSGGQIRVESQQGEWCRFVFTLPTVAPNPGGMKRLPDEAGGEPTVEDPASMKPVE